MLSRRVQACAIVLATAAFVGLSATPSWAQEYAFVKVADSASEGLDPFSFGCASVNTRSDVAFRAGRLAEDGFNVTDAIYRVNASDGALVTIVEDERRFDFISRNPSMNDQGDVSFAANLDRGTEAILRGNGRKLTTIASTAKEFNFFGFDTSVNNAGVVAFKAELDAEFGFDEGMFSGSGKRITTHYLASTSQFDGTDSRPSINNPGAIAFEETVDFTSGVFATAGTGFTTIAAPDPDRSVGEPVVNDAGLAAFETSFIDPTTQEFVSAIVTGDGGPLTTVVDTTGPFGSFGFRPPALNDDGRIAFLATLDDFSTTGIFVGPDPVADRVIATGDTLDGSIVTGLTFCEEGLNDSGHVTFTAFFEDPSTFETRAAVFLATPSTSASALFATPPGTVGKG